MPVYNLDEVRKAVLNGEVIYRGRNVQRDIANLDYELSDVKECLCKLTSDNFLKTHSYNGIAFDAYEVEYQKFDSSVLDRLYIKFCLRSNYLTIEVASFHL